MFQVHRGISVDRETTNNDQPEIELLSEELTSSCSTNFPPPPTDMPNPLNMPLLSPRLGSFLSLCLTSTLKASLSKNNFKSPSCCKVGWAAVLLSILSKAARRDSTKFVSNRPTACFSGGGGTTTPGLLLWSEL